MRGSVPRVFVFFGDAVSESEESGYPVGERHRVAGLGRGHEIDFAADQAAGHFLDAGWTDVRFESGEELDELRVAEADAETAALVDQCRREGAAGIVFRDAVQGGE